MVLDDGSPLAPLEELQAEHRRLLALARTLTAARSRSDEEPPEWAELVGLLEEHTAKEEDGVFRQARRTAPIGDEIDAFCVEHADLLGRVAGGFSSSETVDTLKLLVVQVNGEERDLFPLVIEVLDHRQWAEVAASHHRLGS